MSAVKLYRCRNVARIMSIPGAKALTAKVRGQHEKAVANMDVPVMVAVVTTIGNACPEPIQQRRELNLQTLAIVRRV